MPQPQDRYRVPYAILQGLKAGMQEYQRGREQEKQDVMTKMMMGIPLTEKEERTKEKIGYEIPRGATKIGGVEEEQRRYVEEQRVEQEKYKAEVKQEQAKAVQEKMRWEEERRDKLSQLAIKGATTTKTDLTTMEKVSHVNWEKADEAYQKLLIRHNLEREPLKIPEEEEAGIPKGSLPKNYFLRRHLDAAMKKSKQPKQTMTEEEYLQRRRR